MKSESCCSYVTTIPLLMLFLGMMGTYWTVTMSMQAHADNHYATHAVAQSTCRFVNTTGTMSWVDSIPSQCSSVPDVNLTVSGGDTLPCYVVLDECVLYQGTVLPTPIKLYVAIGFMACFTLFCLVSSVIPVYTWAYARWTRRRYYSQVDAL
jgi:hypothetical protein